MEVQFLGRTQIVSCPIGSIMYGIFTYIYQKSHPNVGKYTSPMDPIIVIKHAFWGKPMLCDVFNLDVLKPLKLVSTFVPPRIYHLDVPGS